jgi:hypothetical protein
VARERSECSPPYGSVAGDEALARARTLTEPHLAGISAEHRQMLAVIARHEISHDLVAASASWAP